MRAKTIGRLVGLMGLAMALTLGLSGKALAATETLDFTVPFSVTACNGDTVTGTVDVHVVETSTTDSNGGTHIDVKVSEHGTGTGSPSGADYVVNAQTTDAHVDTTSGGTVTFTDTLHGVLIGQGSAPNLHITDSLHVTVNPDGTVTAFVTDFEIVCQPI